MKLEKSSVKSLDIDELAYLHFYYLDMKLRWYFVSTPWTYSSQNIYTFFYSYF